MLGGDALESACRSTNVSAATPPQGRKERVGDFDFPVSPPSLNINPFGDGFQNSDGGLSALDNSMADISASNGVTTVSATIGGKRYTATFPGENNSIATETSIENVNGQSTEVFTIT
ncbi:hypothetical protein OSTOST_09342, partial [Ostertagia ostertagi]